MKVFVVIRNERGYFSYKEDEWNSLNTYKNKPIAVFFSQKDAFKYVGYKNYRFFNDIDDGPDDSSWAIVNGYA